MKKAEREQMLRKKLAEMKAFDHEMASGARYIAGCDEVGRGPLAGPVTAACVVLPEDFSLLGVDDSKKLTEKRREALSEAILDGALAYGFGERDNHTIDAINILEATKEAMVDAVSAASAMLRERTGGEIGHLLIDALNLDIPIPAQSAIIKGDQKSVSIAAASIIAKVRRDHQMIRYDRIYPGYSFASNKGYGTKAHYEGIRAKGITEIHRRTFLKNL